jgi:hypothetical protein
MMRYAHRRDRQARKWLGVLRENLLALGAGTAMIPLGDNGAACRSLAARLGELRRQYGLH